MAMDDRFVKSEIKPRDKLTRADFAAKVLLAHLRMPSMPPRTSASSGSVPTPHAHGADKPIAGEPPAANAVRGRTEPQREHGGRAGPEPTRFGDWEKGGRCIDF
jgi:hypothetical protein